MTMQNKVQIIPDWLYFGSYECDFQYQLPLFVESQYFMSVRSDGKLSYSTIQYISHFPAPMV